MARRTTPLFLRRGVYRQRRLRDAARLLPLLGAFLMLLPLLRSRPVVDGASTAFDGIYLFIVWLGLVGVAAALAPGLVSDKAGDDAGGDAP